jgi:16S rRNA processing protein RimM
VTSDKKSLHDSSPVTGHSSLLLVGIVARPHGLSGEVSVEILTDFPERFAPGTMLIWRRKEETRDLQVISARRSSRRILLTFDGVPDVDAARTLAGGELFVESRNAVPAPPGFYYSHEIQGFRCEDPRGHVIGVVRELAQTAAGPMLTVGTPGGKEALVPFVEEMVLQIDRGARLIVLELPEGILDL